MKSEENRLLDLACSISDGDPVDWPDPEDQGDSVSGLRTLSDVARAFQTSAKDRDLEASVLFRWGPLEVLRKVGEGQFGEVFQAWDPQLKRQVALKLNRGPEPLVRTWLAEAQRLAQVRHPNVLAVFGAAVHDERAGLWTELLQGRTLEERLQSEGQLGAGELTVVGTELCRALAAVHAVDLTHGDVKTSNVVRDQDGKLVLIDFGAARRTDGSAALDPQGTPSYLAPEVRAGAPTTPVSDLYALGALLYRMATARYWDSAAESLRTLRPDLPTDLVAAVEALTARDPSLRPKTAGDAEASLLAKNEGAARAASRSPSTAVLAIIAVLVVAALIYLLIPNRTGGPEPLQAAGYQVRLLSDRGGSEDGLASGARVYPGDALSLRADLAESTYVYVFNEDDNGDLFALFPLPGLELSNPLEQGRHYLPGLLDDIEQRWIVTSAGGQERFLVVGSPVPLPELEQLLLASDSARPGRPVQGTDSDAPFEVLRGVGGIESAAPTGRGMVLSEIRSSLVEEYDNVWTDIFVLNNPQ